MERNLHAMARFAHEAAAGVEQVARPARDVGQLRLVEEIARVAHNLSRRPVDICDTRAFA